ncbi:unnamed protein product [Paramecium octaurelia]|uniref:Uncharacterized protein n=1 Tax=Paramecium octaurelia TaxID=43137 RepID=A0A8S1XGM2_PAROT|nr:unnamed protein product [Paramecium octaurelia]
MQPKVDRIKISTQIFQSAIQELVQFFNIDIFKSVEIIIIIISFDLLKDDVQVQPAGPSVDQKQIKQSVNLIFGNLKVKGQLPLFISEY